MADPDWAFMLEKRSGEAFRAASQKLPALKEEAAEDLRRKDASAVRQIRERIVKWAFPELVADLDRTIAAAAIDPAQAPSENGPPWVWILQRRWIDELVKAHCGWKVEDGALVLSGENIRSARTWEDDATGEFRIRFEISGTTCLFFNVRQSAEGHGELALNRAKLQSMAPREHVLQSSLRQEAGTATLDGSPISATQVKTPRTGALPFSPALGRLRIVSLEDRP